MNEQTMYAKSRRRFLRDAGAFAAILGLNPLVPAFARETSGLRSGTSGPIDLNITRQPLDIGGRLGDTVTIGGSIPGPLVRLQEGQDAVLRVTNRLDEDTSIHWHGQPA